MELELGSWSPGLTFLNSVPPLQRDYTSKVLETYKTACAWCLFKDKIVATFFFCAPPPPLE